MGNFPGSVLAKRPKEGVSTTLFQEGPDIAGLRARRDVEWRLPKLALHGGGCAVIKSDLYCLEMTLHHSLIEGGCCLVRPKH